MPHGKVSAADSAPPGRAQVLSRSSIIRRRAICRVLNFWFLAGQEQRTRNGKLCQESMTSRITVQIPPNDLSSIIDAANLSRRNSGKRYIDTAECATLTQKAMKDSATIRVTSHNLALVVSICRVCHLGTREIE